MGILDVMLGTSSEVSAEAVAQEMTPFLGRDEKVISAFKTVRDLMILTNRRLVLVDKTGVTGRKQTWTFVPYGSIVRYELETAGHLDLDSELRVWVKGLAEPIKQEFRKTKGVGQILQVLGSAVG